MVAGQQNKIGLIIQARMKSDRLPGKVMKPIPFPNGEPLLGVIIDQLKNIEAKIILATSTNIENNPLASFCQESKIECFRGSEDDVLSRFIEIQKTHDFDHIVRLTADNPIVDTSILSDFIQYHITNKADYSFTKGLPLGMNFEIINGAALLRSEQYVNSKADREHVTLAIKRETLFLKKCYAIESGLDKLRLTVDTPKDFLTLSAILSCQKPYNLTGLKLIKMLHDKEPWLFEGNAEIFQKNSSIKFNDELNGAINLLQTLDYNRVVKKLKS